MVGWYASAQGRRAVLVARRAAAQRGHAWLGTEHLLAAVLGMWEDPRAGGPALLHACGLGAEQAADLAGALLASVAGVGEPAEPPQATARFGSVLGQALRLAIDASSTYVGTEHLVLGLLAEDGGRAAEALHDRGIDFADAKERFATLPAREEPPADDAPQPLRTLAPLTPAVARLPESARQHAEAHHSDGRVSTLHYLLALADAPGTAAQRLLASCGVTYQELVERLATETVEQLIPGDDAGAEAQPSGWLRLEVSLADLELLLRRLPQLGPGVVFGYQADGDTASVVVSGSADVPARELVTRALRR